MKNVNNHPFLPVFALSTGALLMPAVAQATSGYGLQNVDVSKIDTSKWACKFCPTEQATSGHFTAGVAGSSSSASARFKNSPAEGDGVQGELNAAIRHINEHGRTEASATQLGLRNPAASLDVELNSGLDASVAYRRSEVFSDEGGTTPYSRAGGNQLLLPSQWTAQESTQLMDFSSTTGVTSAKKRGNLTASVEKVFGDQKFKTSATYRRVDRSALDWRSGSILNEVTQLPDAREDSIEEFTVGGEVPFHLVYGNGSVGLEFFRSEYDNDDQSLTWDNPFAPDIDGTGRGRLADAPDNQFQQWRLFGDFSTGPHRFVASATTGTGDQNQTFLPYTINDQLTQRALPKASYEGDVATRNYRLAWNYLINAGLRLQTNYHFDKRANDSAVTTYEPVLTDSLLQGEIDNPLFSHQKSGADLKLEWRWRPSSLFFYDYGYDQFKRSNDYTERATTQSLEFGWRERWKTGVTSQLALRAEERNSDEPSGDVVLGENPYFRDFTLADRVRNKVSMNVVWQCTEATQFRVDGAYLDDDYENTVIGVTNATQADISIGMDWKLDPSVSATMTLQHSRNTWQMNGSSQQTVPTWLSQQKDNTNALILGVRHEGLMEKKLRLGVDYVYTTATGKTYVGASDQGQDLTLDSHSLQAYLDYTITPQWQARLEALMEDYVESDDQTAAINALPGVVSRGTVDEDYNEWMVGMKVRYLIR